MAGTNDEGEVIVVIPYGSYLTHGSIVVVWQMYGPDGEPQGTRTETRTFKWNVPRCGPLTLSFGSYTNPDIASVTASFVPIPRDRTNRLVWTNVGPTCELEGYAGVHYSYVDEKGGRHEGVVCCETKTCDIDNIDATKWGEPVVTGGQFARKHTDSDCSLASYTAYGDLCVEGNVEARFPKTKEEVTAASSNVNMGEVTKSFIAQIDGVAGTEIPWGTSVTLTATPKPHYKFVRWGYYGDEEEDPHGIDGSTNASVTLATLPLFVDQDENGDCILRKHRCHYTAYFEPETYTVHADTSPEGICENMPIDLTVEYGDPASVTACDTDECDYVFEKWSDGTTTKVWTKEHVTSDISIKAIYKRTEYNLYVDTGDLVTATVPSGPFHNGDVVNVYLHPKACCKEIVFVSGGTWDKFNNLVVVEFSCANAYVTVVASIKTFYVSIKHIGEGFGTTSGGGQVSCGGSTHLQAKAYPCSVFKGFSPGPYLHNITSDITVKARFDRLDTIGDDLVYDPEQSGLLIYKCHNGNELLMYGQVKGCNDDQ